MARVVQGRRATSQCAPPHPAKIYKTGGWQGWGHRLGAGNQSSKTKGEQFLPFGEALRVARSLRLVSQKEWTLWCRSGERPTNVPTRPDKDYAHGGWAGCVHWLWRAHLDAGAAPDAALPVGKRAAAGRAGLAAGNGRASGSGAESTHHHQRLCVGQEQRHVAALMEAFAWRAKPTPPSMTLAEFWQPRLTMNHGASERTSRTSRAASTRQLPPMR